MTTSTNTTLRIDYITRETLANGKFRVVCYFEDGSFEVLHKQTKRAWECFQEYVTPGRAHVEGEYRFRLPIITDGKTIRKEAGWLHIATHTVREV